jgi:hypothetical protein
MHVAHACHVQAKTIELEGNSFQTFADAWAQAKWGLTIDLGGRTFTGDWL